MEQYKQASKQRLRVQTDKGVLSVEQLWDLKVTELDKLAVGLEKAYNDSKGKSFLDSKTTKDKDLKLAFDVVLDILETKVEEAAALKQAKEDKEHNEKIFSLIAEKDDAALKGKSRKELMAMLR